MKICPVCNFEYSDSSLLCPNDGMVLNKENQKDPMIGKILEEKYLVSELLGTGGLGNSYLAKDKSENSLVVTISHPHLISNSYYREGWIKTAQQAVKLKHPNILPILDYGVIEHVPYLISELMFGVSLQDLLENNLIFSLSQGISILKPVCDALTYLHSQGISNFAVSPGKIYFIGDRLNTNNIKLSLSLGSPSSIEFMSPEEVQGLGSSHHSQIYSLGVIIYHMLSGQSPFGRKRAKTTMMMLMQHIHKTPYLPKEFNPLMSIATEKCLLKAIAKRPSERQQSVEELFAELCQSLSLKDGNIIENENVVKLKQTPIIQTPQSPFASVSHLPIIRYFLGTKSSINKNQPLPKNHLLQNPQVKLERSECLTNNSVILGSCFAFASKQFLEEQNPNSSNSVQPLITSLLGKTMVDIAGYALMCNNAINLLKLTSLITDKQLYSTGKDTITVIAVVIGKALNNLEIELRCKSETTHTATMRLIKTGETSFMGIVKFSDLLSGEYKARIKGTSTETSFTVAQYQLAPLTATYKNQLYENEEFSFTAKLESFGAPLFGEISLELVEKEQVIEQKIVATDKTGVLQCKFALKGDGPFTVNFISQKDPSKTTTLPIVGSRLQERSKLLIGQLGRTIEASQLPLPNSQQVRGLYLQTTKETEEPFFLENEIGKQARIKCKRDAEVVKVIVINPLNNTTTEQEFLNVKAGKTLTVTIPKPYGILGISAFLDDVAWESWATLIHPSELSLKIDAPKTAEPGKEINIGLKTNLPNTAVPVFLLVKDRRLILTDTLQSGLAREMKTNIEANTHSLTTGHPEKSWNPTYFPTSNIKISSNNHKDKFAFLQRNSNGDESLVHLEIEAYEMAQNSSESEYQGCMYLNPPGTYLIGTAENCDIRLWDEFISPLHAKIVVTETNVEIGTMNGSIFINGQEIDKNQLLKKDDLITFSHLSKTISLRFRESLAPSSSIPTNSIYTPRPEPDYNLTSAGCVVSGDDTKIAINRKTLGKFDSHNSNKSNLASNGSTPNDEPLLEDEFQEKELPEVLFAEVVMVKDQTQIPIKLSSAITEYSIEAFALNELDWQTSQQTLKTSKELFAVINAPSYVCKDDFVLGTILAFAKSGNFALHATTNGQDIPLWLDNKPLNSNPIKQKRAEVTFPLKPGLLKVEVRDLVSNQKDITEKLISEPGHFQYLSRRPKILEVGQKLFVDGQIIKNIELLPNLETPLKQVASATANYQHLCCEQTAAKIFATIFIFFMAKQESERDKAEASIIAGLERERKMWLSGQGFKSYPESSNFVSCWSEAACHHLFSLYFLKSIVADRKWLDKVVDEAITMVEDVAKAHQIKHIPNSIRSLTDAYNLAKHEKSYRSKAVEFVLNQVSWENNQPKIANSFYQPSVQDICYAASTLLLNQGTSNIKLALRLSNWALNKIKSNGMAFSTHNSVAVITLISELGQAGLLNNDNCSTLVKVNGDILSLQEALEINKTISSVEIISGYAFVETTEIQTESWDDFANNIAISLQFLKDNKVVSGNSFKLGERFELNIKLKDGYKEGDFVHICLPACLARLVGGGQVKQFEVDFQGHNEITIPLVAITPTLSKKQNQLGTQHWAIAVRNMYDEDRATKLTNLTVKVE